jgi:hypothetical protein
MSGTTSTAVTISLQISYNTAWTPGYATFPISIANYDGTMPVIAGNFGAVATATVGAYDATTSSCMATLTAVGVGTSSGNIQIEGQDDQDFVITVTQAPLETGSFSQSSVVVFPPAAPAA